MVRPLFEAGDGRMDLRREDPDAAFVPAVAEVALISYVFSVTCIELMVRMTIAEHPTTQPEYFSSASHDSA